MNRLGPRTSTSSRQVAHGEFTELTTRGLPKTGTENYGGPVVTAGGLIFIGGTQDERIHAYDKLTGELLWESDLPDGGYATPADQYAAFALPEG